MKRLRILDTVFLAQLAVRGQYELSNVVAIRGAVVIAQKGQLLALTRQFCPQPRSMMAARTLRDVADIGVNFFLDVAGDVDNAIDKRMPGVIIFVSHGARFKTGGN